MFNVQHPGIIYSNLLGVEMKVLTRMIRTQRITYYFEVRSTTEYIIRQHVLVLVYWYEVYLVRTTSIPKSSEPRRPVSYTHVEVESRDFLIRSSITSDRSRGGTPNSY